MICYHFLSKNALSKVKKNGFLKPNTPLFLIKNINKLQKEHGIEKKNYEEMKSFAKSLPKINFICSIPKSRVKNWANSGLMDEIHRFIKPAYRLEFEVPKKCILFAREHAYSSPKEIKKKFNKERYALIPEPYKTNIWIKYFKSTKRIKSEKDLKNTKVPELWLGCKIPIDKIKITTC